MNTELHIFADDSKYNHVKIDNFDEEYPYTIWDDLYGTKLWDTLVNLKMPFVYWDEVDPITKHRHERAKEVNVAQEAEMGLEQIDDWLRDLGRMALEADEFTKRIEEDEWNAWQKWLKTLEWGVII